MGMFSQYLASESKKNAHSGLRKDIWTLNLPNTELKRYVFDFNVWQFYN